MTETILMHQFVQQKLNGLSQANAQAEMQLKQKPGDIHLLAFLKRVQNDISILSPIYSRLEDELLTSIEKEAGKEFQVLLQHEKPPFKEQVMKLTKAPAK